MARTAVMQTVLLSALISSVQLQEAAALDFFHTEGRHLVSDTSGDSFVFRGVNLTGLEYGAFFENPYPGTPGTNYFVPRTEDLDAIRQVGFNVVRLPFEWARLVPGWTPGQALPMALEPAYLGLIEDVVAAAATREIQVVLEMHDFLKYWSGEGESPVCVDSSSEHQALLLHTWTLLASQFAGEPAVLGFDVMNEPVREEAGEPCGSCGWHAIVQAIVDAIRTVDQDHLVFVEGLNYSLASNWRTENGKTSFVTDSVSPPRIVYSPHVYFDLDNDSRYDDPGEETGPVGAWQHYVRDRLLPAINWSIDNDVPIFIGETGVPCSAGWAAVLDQILRTFLDPMHLSVMAWQYIDPVRCPLLDCPLNLPACPQKHQLDILAQYLGGPFDEPDALAPVPAFSLLYGDERTHPWDAGPGFFDSSPPGIAVDFCAASPVFQGSCSLSVAFTENNYAALKLHHHFGLDARNYDFLTFQIFLTGAGMQDFQIFTTSPIPDCSDGLDPIYPPGGFQPRLSDYLVNPLPDRWQRVVISLHAGSPQGPIVDPQEPILNAIAFQNLGVLQPEFFIDDVRLLPNAIFADGFESGDLTRWSGSVPAQLGFPPITRSVGATPKRSEGG